MTLTAPAVDITPTAPAAPPARPWLRYLPWALFGVTALALAATLLPKPAEPVPVPAPEPSVFVGEQSGTGGQNLRILQDANGRVTGAVLVVDGDEAWCRLVVDGAVVVGAEGSPAVCIWARP
jgi:hypothetical protein